MKVDFKWTAILIGLIVVCSVATGAVHGALEGTIAQNDFGTEEEIDITELLPEASSLKKLDMDIPEDSDIQSIQGAYDGDELKGYIIKTDSEGAYSTISIAIAITNEGEISGIEILSQNETEGLGDEIADDEFTSRFKSKTAKTPLTLVDDETSAKDEVQGLSGATISAQAVVDGVNTAIEFFNTQLEGGN